MRLKEGGHYETSGLIEVQFEPGSRGRVLRNLLSITRKAEMDRVEAALLKRAVDVSIRKYGPQHRFTAADICQMHKMWLGSVYVWAGVYRRVNMTKGEFPFAAAAQIPALMREFEQGPLRRYTPCTMTSAERVIRALAEVHTELVLIHPFRDGNGRVARILVTLMALQAGFLLDFRPIQGSQRKEYFAAVQAGVARNYAPMEQIFSGIVRRSFGGP
jgi:cell filamentation protein